MTELSATFVAVRDPMPVRGEFPNGRIFDFQQRISDAINPHDSKASFPFLSALKVREFECKIACASPKLSERLKSIT